MVRLANVFSDMHGHPGLCMRSATLALRGPRLAVCPQASIRHLGGRGPDRVLTDYADLRYFTTTEDIKSALG